MTASLSQFGSLIFELSTMSMTAAIIIFFFYRNIKKFNVTNPNPKQLLAHPLKLAKEDHRIVVKTGLFIRDFPLFDITHNTFIADVIVWFEYNPQKVPRAVVSTFSFEQAVILQKLEGEALILSDILSLLAFRIRLQFAGNLDYRFFPLGNHQLDLALDHREHADYIVQFETAAENFSCNALTIPGWQLIGRDAQAGYASVHLDPRYPQAHLVNPRVLFLINFARNGMRKIVIIMLPIFLAFFIGFLALTLNPLKHPQSMTNLGVTSITGLLAYRFVIENLSPNVGYFTLTDHIFNIFLTFTFIVFVINICILEIANISPAHITLVKIVSMLMVEIGLIISFYYLLYRWK